LNPEPNIAREVEERRPNVQSIDRSNHSDVGKEDQPHYYGPHEVTFIVRH